MKKYITGTALLLALTATSCKDYLEEVPVATVSYSYYETEKGLEDLINAAYSELRWKVNGEQAFTLFEYGVDEVRQAADGQNKHYDSYNSLLNPADQGGFLHDMWTTYYRGINSCNIGLERIPELKGGTAGLKDDASKRIRMAELRFLRAYYLFELVQQFGAIPLPLKGTVGVALEFDRQPVSTVYNQIIADMRYAVENLPVSQTQYGRATKGAAQHYLAKVYLTRGSAVKDQRGQKATDMDSAAVFADQVINSGRFQLVSDYSDLWKITNQVNNEVIFTIQFNNNLLLLNNSGNRAHLYFGMVYDNKPGMLRDLENGRPFRRIRPTEYTFNVFDRRNDSRFYKSFKWVYLANNAATIPKWTAADAPSSNLVGQPKFAVGDTAIYLSMENNVPDSRIARVRYNFYPKNKHDLQIFPPTLKHFDPTRDNFQSEFGTRDHFLARLAETYLIAAEAYGRKGDYAKAATYINVLRKRAAYKQGEVKTHQHWTVEGGRVNDLGSTENAILVDAAYWDTNVPMEQYPASATSKAQRFIHFILNERTRELYGELHRWNDLARTETLVERVRLFNEYATGLQDFHRLRPVPLAHIERLFKNGQPLTAEQRTAEQNPGY
ncbi:RagB/SusD family nutrient uptake outer membrane protein [Tellurirhabdus rosea]|uniref:RagB/SusD family nutrient uptake outer membrane protein n=1 Tax=Tellurirhabdus rosea TaxID=2674997 RepID=UPI0022570118|nr:RagB/SusD family nutrient uptake outer membrane protein [Tellurirhabdus rosea]